MSRFLFLDPGADVTRRDIYGRARELGMEVILLSRDLGWEREHVDDWIEGDPTSVSTAVAAARAVAPLAGVVNCSESCLEAAAGVSEACGVPGLPTSVARLCRDKVLMAERLLPEGIPMARRCVVTTEQEAVTAAESIGLPGVLKPSTGVASLFTVKYESISELQRRFRSFQRALRDRSPAPLRDMGGRWLIEEFVEGPAFSVESVTFGGRTTHVAVCEKGPIAPPFFCEVGHSTPPTLSASDVLKLERLTDRTIKALDLDDCVTHTEFKLTPAGPVLLEIGARMGGGSIRQVVALAHGVDLVDATLEIAMGNAPTVAPTGNGGAASRSLYPPLPGRIARVQADSLLELPGIIAVNKWMEPGDVYERPPKSYREVLGVVARGNNAATAVERADRAIAYADSEELISLTPLEGAM